LERDLRNFIQVKDLRQFRLFLKRCAANAAQILNMNALATEVGVSVPTVKSWLSVLESSYITFTLPPYFRNFNKRITKSPKLFFYDTGLVCNLLEMESPNDVDRYFQRGSLLENLIVAELHKARLHRGKRPFFYFWRDSNQNEVDVLWEEAGQIQLLEIKSGKTFTKEWLTGLQKVSDLMGDQVGGKRLVYGGEEPFEVLGTKVIGWSNF